MINNEIIKIASNTSNVGLTNEYTFKSSKKNSLCGDLIKVELILKRTKIISMKYETECCIYCEASASLLAKKIKNLDKKVIEKKISELKKIDPKETNLTFPKNFSEFKFLMNKDNFSRLKCVFLPLDAVLKALNK